MSSDLCAVLGMKSPACNRAEMEPVSSDGDVIRPNQRKYRKTNLPDWRKAHNSNRLRLLRSGSMLEAIHDDVQSFVFGPPKLSAAARAWEHSKKQQLLKEKLHRERMEFAALTLPRFAERMAEIRETRLIAWARVLAKELFVAWKKRSYQRVMVKRMMGKAIEERLAEMMHSWKHTAKTIRAFRNMKNRGRLQNLQSRIMPWYRFMIAMRKKRRYAYAVFRATVIYERNQYVVGTIHKAWFVWAHRRSLTKKAVYRMRMSAAWQSFHSWKLFVERARQVKRMLRRYLSRLERSTFERFAEYLKMKKKERRRKIKLFASRMKTSRMLPSWNGWYSLHCMHKVAKFVQSAFRGHRSREITTAMRAELLAAEKERSRIEEEEYAARISDCRRLHRKRLRQRDTRVYYRHAKLALQRTHTETLAMLRGTGRENDTRESFHAIFKSFCHDPRRFQEKKFEVVDVHILRHVCAECGFRMSKKRFEIFVHRCNFLALDAIGFDEFFKGLQQMNLLSSKEERLPFSRRVSMAVRRKTGLVFHHSASLKAKNYVMSEIKRDILTEIRSVQSMKPLHHCPHCMRGYVFYTELFDHLEDAPHGCQALLSKYVL